MSKQKWKAGNMIYPLPAVMVSCGTSEQPNIVTVGWTGTVCTNPAMTYISLRKTRHSYQLIEESGCFVINLTTRKLVKATDFCGVKSGRDLNKFKEMQLTPVIDDETGCPMIEESPVSIVCRVTEIKELGSHDMFIAEVTNVYIDDAFMDETGKFHLNHSDLITYSHGTYFTLGEALGTFGYSVMKPKTQKDKNKKEQLKKGQAKSQEVGEKATSSHKMSEKKRKGNKNYPKNNQSNNSQSKNNQTPHNKDKSNATKRFKSAQTVTSKMSKTQNKKTNKSNKNNKNDKW